MTDKKLFSSLYGLVIGAVAGVGIVAAPAAALADHHNGQEESGKKSCSGEKSCSDDKKCSGDKNADMSDKKSSEDKSNSDDNKDDTSKK